MNRNLAIALWSLLIGGLFVIGAIQYFSAMGVAGNHVPGLSDLTSFIPSAVAFVGLGLYNLVAGLGSLLDTYGLQVMMVLLAFISSIILFVLGVSSSDDGNKSAYFSFAGTALGFSLGIPVGSWNPARKAKGGTNGTRK